MHRIVVFILLGLLVAGLAACTGILPAASVADIGCTDALGCVELAPDEPIALASLVVTSGSVAALGIDQEGAIEIALAEYGPIHGHDIVLLREDSQCNAEGGQTAASKVVVNPAVAGILGPACSSAATAALPLVSEAGLTMIAASTTSPTLTDPDREAGGVWQPGYYRTSHNDLFLGEMAARFAFEELGARSVATVHDGSIYAERLQRVMGEVFEDLGGTVTHRGALNVGDTDMRPLLTEIAVTAPEVLFFPIFQPEGNLLAVQARETPGLEDTILLGAAALFAEDFPVNTGTAALGMYMTGPLVGSEEYRAFLEQWSDMHGTVPPGGYHAHMYDASRMLLDAIHAAVQVDERGYMLIGKQAIRDYLNQLTAFRGLTGSLTCSDTGDCATGEALAIYQINDLDAWPPEVVYQPVPAAP